MNPSAKHLLSSNLPSMTLLRNSSISGFSWVISCLLIYTAFVPQYAICKVLPVDLLYGKNPNSTLSVSGDAVDFRCSHDKTWVDTRFFEVKQCYVAIMFMMHEEGIDPTPSGDPPKREEFIAQNARPQQGSSGALLTPRKYTARKQALDVPSPCTQAVIMSSSSAKHWPRILDECTLAILMRSDVYPGDLPRGEGHALFERDVSSFEDIANAALAVFDFCGRSLRVPGWASVGKFCPNDGSRRPWLLRSC